MGILGLFGVPVFPIDIPGSHSARYKKAVKKLKEAKTAAKAKPEAAYKPRRNPSGIQAKRRSEKVLSDEGVRELKSEKDSLKRGELIETFNMDKINAMISRMRLQNNGSKTDKVDRILMAIDKKLPKEHRYFEASESKPEQDAEYKDALSYAQAKYQFAKPKAKK